MSSTRRLSTVWPDRQIGTRRNRLSTWAPGTDAGQRLPARLDTILVADATGDTAAFWFYRGECEAVIRTGMAGQRPNTDLVARLDSVLG